MAVKSSPTPEDIEEFMAFERMLWAIKDHPNYRDYDRITCYFLKKDFDELSKCAPYNKRFISWAKELHRILFEHPIK